MDLRKEDHEPLLEADEVGVEVPDDDMMGGLGRVVYRYKMEII